MIWYNCVDFYDTRTTHISYPIARIFFHHDSHCFLFFFYHWVLRLHRQHLGLWSVGDTPSPLHHTPGLPQHSYTSQPCCFLIRSCGPFDLATKTLDMTMDTRKIFGRCLSR